MWVPLNGVFLGLSQAGDLQDGASTCVNLCSKRHGGGTIARRQSKSKTPSALKRGGKRTTDGLLISEDARTPLQTRRIIASWLARVSSLIVQTSSSERQGGGILGSGCSSWS